MSRRSAAEELEHLGLARRDHHNGITWRWKDLGGFPLPLHHARGDASLHAPLGLLCPELARVKEKHRLDAPRRVDPREEAAADRGPARTR